MYADLTFTDQESSTIFYIQSVKSSIVRVWKLDSESKCDEYKIDNVYLKKLNNVEDISIYIYTYVNIYIYI